MGASVQRPAISHIAEVTIVARKKFRPFAYVESKSECSGVDIADIDRFISSHFRGLGRAREKGKTAD